MKNLIINPKFGFAATLAVYFLLAALTIHTWLPMCDEAWFANPAFNLMNHGFFGTTVLEETANFRQVRLDGINQYTYWIMPLYPLSQIVWYKIFGFGLMPLRLSTVFWGAVNLAAWFFLIKKLTKKTNLALLVAGLLAVDFHFLQAAAIGRMDMMTAALGTAALAVYAVWRERNLNLAVASSNALVAAAFFTHPLGLLYFACLVLLAALYDWRELRLRHLPLAAASYLIFAAGWAVYILQRPDLFALQFGGNASDRWAFFRQPLTEIWREIKIRYLVNFGIGADLNVFGQIKILTLAIFVLAILSILIVPTLRRERSNLFLLGAAFVQFALLLLLDSMKQPQYMIHIVPTLIALFAVWLGYLWRRDNRTARAFGIGLLTAVCLVSFATVALRIRRDAYHQNYLAAAGFLNQNAQPTDLIMASAEFWFALDNNLTDDYRLGFRTGKQANFIVMDAPRYQDWQRNLEQFDLANFERSRKMLAEDYSIVYEDQIYKIYELKSETRPQ